MTITYSGINVWLIFKSLISSMPYMTTGLLSLVRDDADVSSVIDIS